MSQDCRNTDQLLHFKDWVLGPPVPGSPAPSVKKEGSGERESVSSGDKQERCKDKRFLKSSKKFVF